MNMLLVNSSWEQTFLVQVGWVTSNWTEQGVGWLAVIVPFLEQACVAWICFSTQQRQATAQCCQEGAADVCHSAIVATDA